jgi:hypothetical protein
VTEASSAAAAAPPEHFERDYACTEAEWLRWLPEAVHGHTLAQPQAGLAVVALPPGTLTLQWQALPPRRIALIVLPRLAVRFVFEAVPPPVRAAFLRRFDLFTQRGGG